MTARVVVSHEAHQNELSRLSAEELLSRVDVDYNKISVGDLLAMLGNAATLQESIAALRASGAKTQIGGPRNRPALQAADTAATALNSFIGELWSLVPVQQRPTTGQAAAQVIAIPELLEMILMQATPETVLAARRVSGHWRQSVTNSPRLNRDNLTLVTWPTQPWRYYSPFEDYSGNTLKDEDAEDPRPTRRAHDFWFTPSKDFPGITYKTSTQWQATWNFNILQPVYNRIFVHITIHSPWTTRIPAYLQPMFSMFICQPRLLSINCSGVHPNNYDPPQPEPPATVASPTGLRLGDLWMDAHQRLLNVNAYTLFRDETLAEARARRTVTYWALITLDPRDPIMLDRQKVVADLVAAKEARRVNRILRGASGSDSGSSVDYFDEADVILSPMTEFTSGSDSN